MAIWTSRPALRERVDEQEEEAGLVELIEPDDLERPAGVEREGCGEIELATSRPTITVAVLRSATRAADTTPRHSPSDRYPDMGTTSYLGPPAHRGVPTFPTDSRAAVCPSARWRRRVATTSDGTSVTREGGSGPPCGQARNFAQRRLGVAAAALGDRTYGWKCNPSADPIGLGTSPWSTGGRFFSGSGVGAALSRALVYGCFGPP